MGLMTSYFLGELTMKRRQKYWLIGLLGTLSAFGPLSMDMYLPALPKLQQDLHTTTSLTQLSITTCLIGLAVGQLLIGPISDRIGRKKPTLIGLIIFTIASLLAALATNVWWLLCLRLCQGLAGAAGLVTSRAIASDLFTGSELTKFYALLMAVNGIFPVIAPIIGGFVLSFASWRGIFMILTAVGGVLCFAVLFGLRETHPQTNTATTTQPLLPVLRQLSRDPIFMGYTLIAGLVTGGLFGYISGSSFMLQNIFGLSSQAFSLLYALNGLGIVIMSQLVGPLTTRYSEQQVLHGSIWVALIGALLLCGTLILPHQLRYVILPLFLIVSMVGIAGTLGSALAMAHAQKYAGSASAILGLIQNLIGGLLSPFVGILGKNTYVPMAVLILLCELGALAIYQRTFAKK